MTYLDLLKFFFFGLRECDPLPWFIDFKWHFHLLSSLPVCHLASSMAWRVEWSDPLLRWGWSLPQGPSSSPGLHWSGPISPPRASTRPAQKAGRGFADGLRYSNGASKTENTDRKILPLCLGLCTRGAALRGTREPRSLIHPGSSGNHRSPKCCHRPRPRAPGAISELSWPKNIWILVPWTRWSFHHISPIDACYIASCVMANTWALG